MKRVLSFVLCVCLLFGTLTVSASADSAVAQVGETTYTTFDEAWLAAIAAGGSHTIALLADAGFSVSTYTVRSAVTLIDSGDTVTKAAGLVIPAPDGYGWPAANDGMQTLTRGDYVAEVNGVSYDTFEAAWGAAGSDSTITLLKNVNNVGSVSVGGGDRTLDLNGKTLSTNGFGIYNSGNWTGTLLISGSGTIDFTAEDAELYGAALDPEGGEMTLQFPEGTSGEITAKVQGSGTLTLDGCELTLKDGSDLSELTLNSTNGAVVKKASSATVTLPEGYQWSEDNILTQKTYAAQVGETKYETLNEAMAAAINKYGDAVVTVLSDCSCSINSVDYFFAFAMSEDTVTLDLNGKTVTFTTDVMMLYGNSLLVTGDGTMVFEGDGALRAFHSGYSQNASIIIESGTVVNNTDSFVLIADNAGSVIVNSGTFTDEDHTPVIAAANNSSSVILNGGTFSEGALVVNSTAPSVTKGDAVELAAPSGYAWEAGDNGKDILVKADTLAQAKEAAKTELENYKSPDAYRDAQKAELATAVAAGKAAIDDAADEAAVAAALAGAKDTIDTIKTAAELDAEEAPYPPDSYAILVSPTKNGTVTVKQSHANEGDTVTITAEPERGYGLDSLTVTDSDGAQLQLRDKGNGKYSFIMPAADVTVSAAFSKRSSAEPADPWELWREEQARRQHESYTISAEAGEGGRISAPGETAVAYGRKQTYTIVPDFGYAIRDVFVDGKNVGAVQRYTFRLVDRDHTITARFVPAPYENNFTDVADDHRLLEDIAFVCDFGLISPLSADRYAPDEELDRGTLMTALARHAGKNTDGGDPWYAPGMTWAMNAGISDGSAPMSAITREQMVTMLWRYAGYMGLDRSVGENTNILSYADAFDVSDYAVSAMQWACGAGIITGKDGGRLDPQGNTTRAEMAAVLHRFVLWTLG